MKSQSRGSTSRSSPIRVTATLYHDRFMKGRIANLTFAALTDVGRKRLANEDAVAIDPYTGMFVVCDGVGGRPSGEAASQIIARAMPRVFRRHLRRTDAISADTIQDALIDAAVAMNASMYRHSTAVPTLEGMGCTLAAALIDGPTLYHLHAGDSRLYMLRRGDLFPLTADHTYSQPIRRTPEPHAGDPAADEGDEGDEKKELLERRLLMQYMGKPEALVPETGSVPLEDGDRLLICSDGLTDPVPDDLIADLLRDHAAPKAACTALVARANELGGPDNITVTVIDYAGLRERLPADLERPTAPPRSLPGGAAEKTHAALMVLEQDLNWLLLGARAAAHPKRLTALAAAKRHLDTDAYRAFLRLSANQSLLHAFHQSCVTPDAAWRKQYEEHMATLKKAFKRLASGSVVMCPTLTAAESAGIVRELWGGWRRVEQRYFATCQRDAIHESERTLDVLISHMLGSVQTLTGLLTFFPRFMAADTGTPAPAADPVK